MALGRADPLTGRGNSETWARWGIPLKRVDTLDVMVNYHRWTKPIPLNQRTKNVLCLNLKHGACYYTIGFHVVTYIVIHIYMHYPGIEYMYIVS